MFSRSDKTEEVYEDAESEPTERSPMLLAVLAGLLALVGAFLLVRYLSDNNSSTTVADPAAAESSQEVLVVTDLIPAGTDVSTILESPTIYLAARAVPDQFVAASAITSIAELRELDGLTLSSDALAGEQLLRGRFIDRNDFTGDSVIERNAAVDVPEGHHTVVVTLPSSQALGAQLNFGEKVSVISSFRVDPVDADPFEVSVVVLPAVEVIDSRTTAEVTGQFAGNADQLGVATLGDVFVTLAVEPTELTQLTFAMKYGDIILAGALPEATEDDLRPITTIETIIEGTTFVNDEDLLLLLGDSLSIDDDGTIEGIEGGDIDQQSDAEATESDESESSSGGAAGVQDNSDGNLGPEGSGSSGNGAANGATAGVGSGATNGQPVPPTSGSGSEPEPAGPGEQLPDQFPNDDSDASNGALPPEN